jgi:nucleoside-diphosphate-sugar epimerase
MSSLRVKTRRAAILVSGGTGFVGSAVVHELLTKQTPARQIRVLSRREIPKWMAAAGVAHVRVDLAEPNDLSDAVDGVGTLVHLASYSGPDPEHCQAVNTDGTKALLAAARKAKVQRVVHLSTSAIYGVGTHRRVSESLVAPAPVSPVDRSRLAAERAVRAAGGVVLRPHLIYGQGDVWFVPAVVRMSLALPAWVDGGRAMASLISVDDLAKVIARLTTSGWEPSSGAVFHVNHPRPVSVRELITTLAEHIGFGSPATDLPRSTHRELLARAMPALTDHQFSLLADDHWYDSDRIWIRLSQPIGPGFAEQLSGSASWYRAHLAELLTRHQEDLLLPPLV